VDAQQKPHVLVIDDDAGIRQLLGTALSCAGFDVVVAEDGESGLAKIGERHFDLILLDMVLPGVNGWGVLRRLPPEPPPLPVIAMSGEYVSPAALGLMSNRVRAYIMKPLRLAHLIQTCDCVLSAREFELAPRTHERRSEARYVVLLPITILDAGRRPLAVGRATNLSLCGIQVYLGADIAAGQEVRMALELPPDGDSIRLRALTRWSNRGFAGLSFVNNEPSTVTRLERIMRESHVEDRQRMSPSGGGDLVPNDDAPGGRFVDRGE